MPRVVRGRISKKRSVPGIAAPVVPVPVLPAPILHEAAGDAAEPADPSDDSDDCYSEYPAVVISRVELAVFLRTFDEIIYL